MSGLTPCAFASEPSAEYETEYVKGEVLFGYEPPAYTSSFFKKSAPVTLDEQLEQAGITEYEDLYKNVEDEHAAVANSFSCQSVADDEFPEVFVAKTDGDVLETCEKLKKINGVTYAEPNYLCHTDSLPLEITNGSQIYNTWQKWYLDDVVNVKQTWESYDVTGDGVTIAVIDNGFKTDTTEFPANLWLNSNGTPGWNAYSQNYDISPITYSSSEPAGGDMSWHGTHVASSIGMLANGIYGVGPAYGAELMLLKVATTDNAISIAAITRAIDYAVTNHADIITISIGATGSESSYTTLKNAVRKAYSNGIPLFASAGNDHIPANEGMRNYPAAFENIAIGVMASDKEDTGRLASFSNYDTTGKYYDVAAPGVQILGCTPDGLSVAGGTSQATPLVAACAALYLEEYPDATVDEVYEAIRKSPTVKIKGHPDVTKDTTRYYKSLNALEMLDYSKVKPVVTVNTETQAVINKNLSYIYGLDEGFASLSDYVSVQDGTGSGEVVPTDNGLGTGAKFNVYDLDNNLYEAYTVIVFGDINGDTFADAQDAVLMKIMLNNMLTPSEIQRYAADSDFSGDFDENDITMNLENAINLNSIPQTR